MEGRGRDAFRKSADFLPSADLKSQFPAFLYERANKAQATSRHASTSPAVCSLLSSLQPSTPQALDLETQRKGNSTCQDQKGRKAMECGKAGGNADGTGRPFATFQDCTASYNSLPLPVSHDKENSENLANSQGPHARAKSITAINALPALSEPCQHALLPTLSSELSASAERLLALARKEKGKHRYQQCIKGLTEAWELVQNSKGSEVCRVGVKLAKALILHSSDFSTAGYLLSVSSKPLDEMSPSQLTLKTQFCQGLLQFHSGRYTEAASLLIRISAEFSYTECYSRYCWQVRYYLIRALLESNRKAEATANYAKWHSEEPTSQKDKSLQKLLSALISTQQGQYREAECSHFASKSLCSRPESIYAVYNLHQLGSVYYLRKLYRKAMPALATAHQLYASHFPTVRDFCDLLTTRAAVYARTCLFTTEIKLRISADSIYASHYLRTIDRAANAVKLAAAYRDSKQLKAAERTAIQSIDLAEAIEPNGTVLAQGLSVLAEIHHRSGSTHLAVPLLERAQLIYESVGSVELQCAVNYRLLGDLTARVHHPSTACYYYTKACCTAFRALVHGDSPLYQVVKAGEGLIRLRQYSAAGAVFRRLVATADRWRVNACAALLTITRETKEFDTQEMVVIRGQQGTERRTLKTLRTVYQP